MPNFQDMQDYLSWDVVHRQDYNMNIGRNDYYNGKHNSINHFLNESSSLDNIHPENSHYNESLDDDIKPHRHLSLAHHINLSSNHDTATTKNRSHMTLENEQLLNDNFEPNMMEHQVHHQRPSYDRVGTSYSNHFANNDGGQAHQQHITSPLEPSQQLYHYNMLQEIRDFPNENHTYATVHPNLNSSKSKSGFNEVLNENDATFLNGSSNNNTCSTIPKSSPLPYHQKSVEHTPEKSPNIESTYIANTSQDSFSCSDKENNIHHGIYVTPSSPPILSQSRPSDLKTRNRLYSFCSSVPAVNVNGTTFTLPPNQQLSPHYLLPTSFTQDPNNERERKIMRYRSKRSRRNYSPSIDQKLSVSAQMRKRDQSGHFLPTDKDKNAYNKNSLSSPISSSVDEDIISKLNQFMVKMNREIVQLRFALYNQYKEIVALKEQSSGANLNVKPLRSDPSAYLQDNGSVLNLPPPLIPHSNYNAQASTQTTSHPSNLPIHHPPSTKSTIFPQPSNPGVANNEILNLYSHANNNNNASLESPQQAISNHNQGCITHPSLNSESMNGLHAYHEGTILLPEHIGLNATSMSDDVNRIPSENRLQEKLKILGGPPSDVYYPWWNGSNIDHPAFKMKEDWPNNELRPVGEVPNLSALGRERLDSILSQQRWKQEQLRITTKSRESLLLPIKNEGYWSGNYVPYTDKIDFSKIYLRKTGPANDESLTEGQPISHLNNEPHVQYTAQNVMIPTPTAAIWKEAMLDPGLFKGYPFPNFDSEQDAFDETSFKLHQFPCK